MSKHLWFKGTFWLFIFALWALPAFAQDVDTAWVRRYDGGSIDIDYARGLVLDASGNVYVTGYSRVGNIDYATIKYAPDGTQLWVDRYNGTANADDIACAIGVDGSGNIAVTGTAGNGVNPDYLTIKYYPGGSRAWTKSLNAGLDFACDLAIDNSGNVCVTGYNTVNFTVPLDYLTVKYYPNGDTAWVRRFNGPANGDDSTRAIAVDNSGNVYVTGQCKISATQRGIGTIKYDPAGNFVYAWYVPPPPSTVNNNASDIVVDVSGNVYVAGRGYGTGGFDYYTAKYDAGGTYVWIKTYDGPGNSNDEARSLVLDGSGNIYVTGYSVGSGTNRDIATIKYASDGTQLWVQRYNGPGNNSDEALDIALDNSGNIYITGYSYDVGGDWDYITIKYASDGTQLWEKRYKGPVLADAAYAIAVDDFGNVYVTGESQSDNYDYLTIKYWQNYAPNTFSLVLPSDNAFVSSLVDFDWEDATDPDPWDTVRYDLYVSTSPVFHPDSTSVYDSLLTSDYSDNFEIGVYYWKVRAYDNHGETWSTETRSFVIESPSGLTGYWKFDEGTGVIAHDGSGYGNDGTLINGPTWVGGKINMALNFDGTDDCVEVADNPSLSVFSQLTLAAWVKLSSFSSGVTVIAKDAGTGLSEAEYKLGIWDNKVYFCVSDGVQWLVWIESGDVIDSLEKWYHIAVVWNESTSAIYVNGSLVSSGAAIAGTSQDTPHKLYVGTTNSVPGTFLNGKIDEVMIYRRALNEQEIKNIAMGVVGYWKFEEGSGDIAYDSSGYGNDGTLMNGPPTWVNGLPLLGEALDFDGTDDFVRIDKSEIIISPSYTRAITVMAWVKPDSGFLDRLGRVVVSHWWDESGTCPYGDPSNAWVIEAHQADGKYHSAIGAGDGTYGNLPSKTSVKEGVWQHVAFTWDGSLITFYFNGIADTSTTYVGNMANSACYMEIGKTDLINYVWKGLEDEVKLYNRALSPEEIRAEFENGFSRGDANADGQRTVSDVVYLINYLFKGGPSPQPLPAGDANCDQQVTVSDVVYLVNYLFKGGPPPGC